jgi:hypothetical protein
MIIAGHAIAVLTIGYVIARTIRAIVTKLVSPIDHTYTVGQWRNRREECPIEFMGRLTFWLAMLMLLLVFSDVFDLLMMTGGIGSIPIYGPNGEGLLSASSRYRPQAVVSMSGQPPNP